MALNRQSLMSMSIGRTRGYSNAACLAVALLLLGSLLGSCKPLRDRRQIPPYVRGKGQYQWILSEWDRERSITYFGTGERLRMKMHEQSQGKQMKVTAIGGSITVGQGTANGLPWTKYMENYLQDYAEPGTGNWSVHVGAVSGTVSTYMSLCHNIHVPRDSDIVFLEYSINDPQAPSPHFTNSYRTGFERLVRKLLNYPNKPALVMLHAYSWNSPAANETGLFWNNAEREFAEFAWFYNLPMASLKTAAFALMAHKVPGFEVDRGVRQDPKAMDRAFYFDRVHPDGRTGSRVLGELAVNVLLRAQTSLRERPITERDQELSRAPLIRPMIPGNYESSGDRCLIGHRFVDSVVRKDPSWKWVDEGNALRAKWGYVSNVTGSAIYLKVDTRSRGAPGAVAVDLAYLKSYQNMGTANVTCVSGCKCAPSEFNGHTLERNSQVHLHSFLVSQHKECVVAVTVQSKTKSGRRKVKISGLIVSEQANPGIKNNRVVGTVHNNQLMGGGGGGKGSADDDA